MPTTEGAQPKRQALEPLPTNDQTRERTRLELASKLQTWTEGIRRAIDWNKHLPRRLAARLVPRAPATRPEDHGIPEGPIILCLYAGPDGHEAIDWAIQLVAPWLTPFVLALDTLRDATRHNMLSDDLYAHLAAKARHGEILAILGGPNCRTWSILLHKPLPNGTPGHPLRGREEPACWGLGDLTPEERLKTDDDSILALRLLELYAIARG